jgi:signal transduction histidine kinase
MDWGTALIPIKLSRRLSTRLTIVFVVTLFLSCIGVGSVVYYSLTDTLKRTEFAGIEERALDYRHVYQAGGIDSLRKFINDREARGSERKVFVRLQNLDGVVFQTRNSSVTEDVNYSDGWHVHLAEPVPEKTLRKLDHNLKQFILNRGWTSLLLFFNFEVIYTYKIPVSHDLWIIVGESLKSSEKEFLRARMIGLSLMGIFIIIGLILGYAVSKTVISPVKNFLVTIKEIETGNLTARVRPSTRNDEIDFLMSEFNRLMDTKALLIENINSTLDTVAHEIRTPLTRLRISSELALGEKDDPGLLKKAVIEGLAASEQISSLLTTILESSRAKNGLVNLQISHFKVQTLLAELQDIYQFLLEDKKMGLEILVENDLSISADRRLLLQALNNLIDNAIKYSPVGSKVLISVESFVHEIRFSIVDKGPGIDEEEQVLIWQRLYRSRRNQNEDGYGIGLSIVKVIAEVHGGSATVESKLGEGSTFILRLPQARL